MTNTPKHLIVCMKEHDHATAEDCRGKAAEAYIDLTPQEIAERDQRQAENLEREALREQEEAAKTALKESAKAKLIAGEPLTEEEAAVLVI